MEKITNAELAQLFFQPNGDIDKTWAEFGECNDAGEEVRDVFFLENRIAIEQAKVICRKCVVQEECREWSIVTEQKYGVWGGLSRRERNKEIKHLKE